MDQFRTRRLFICICISAPALLLSLKISRAERLNSSAAEGRLYNLRWRVSKAHFETVRNNLDFKGKIETEKDQKGVPLVFVFVGIVLLPYLSNAVLALRRDIVYGGLIIDTRGAQILIENDSRLDGGTIVVVTTDGTKIYRREEIGTPSDLIRALLMP